MEIVLNDKSLEGQFTEESFLDYMCKEVIPGLQLLEKSNCIVYKAYDTYQRKITKEKDFLSFLRMQGEPAIDSLKIYLVQLSGREPYWNDDRRTKQNVEYSCIIKEIPNCITETYERDGVLYSFPHENFESTYLQLLRDGKKWQVKNAFSYSSLKVHLIESGIIDIWDKNSFYIAELGYKFEIRFNEHNHNIAHFHVSNADYSASLSIPDADVIVGNFPGDEEKKIVSWALRNMAKIVELWNRSHPEKEVIFQER